MHKTLNRRTLNLLTKFTVSFFGGLRPSNFFNSLVFDRDFGFTTYNIITAPCRSIYWVKNCNEAVEYGLNIW